MDFTTLAVLVFAAVLLGLWRAGELRVFQAVIAGLFGFYLAASRLAPTISGLVEGAFGWVSTWQI
jgi:hypothetical protein